ncbi:hypothetical protein VNO77_04688 [Canavalia gladiata]|uniref:Uncharacterized protein n=1 Tax=Canavalia gladiata TaxID=3824 RepID=A0AAN9R7Z4_CANGL
MASATTKLGCGERLSTSVKSRLCSCCNPCSPSGNRLACSPNTEQVSVGRHFQAEVPKWTGLVSKSDSKWLGTQVWPLKQDSKPTVEIGLLERERHEKCGCKFQGLVECALDHMGVEFFLQWTIEKEKKFKDIMRSSIPSQNKSFWNKPSKRFPKKTRKKLGEPLLQCVSHSTKKLSKSGDSEPSKRLERTTKLANH